MKLSLLKTALILIPAIWFHIDHDIFKVWIVHYSLKDTLENTFPVYNSLNVHRP